MRAKISDPKRPSKISTLIYKISVERVLQEKYSALYINPATLFFAFSPCARFRSKALKRSFSRSKASFNNAVCGNVHMDLSL